MVEKSKSSVTVRIREDLLKDAKHAAVDADLTLTDWLSEAVEEKLAGGKAKVASYSPPLHQRTPEAPVQMIPRV